jgi:hypothetical protein
MIHLILTIVFTNQDYGGREAIQSLVVEEQADGSYLIDWDSSKVHAKDIHEVADQIQNIANLLKMQAKATMEAV